MRKSTHMNLTDLPSVLLHYKKTDLEVIITDEAVSVQTSGGYGTRESVIVYNLRTGNSIRKTGDWGGATPFRSMASESPDMVPVEYEIDEDTMIAVLVEGGTNAHKNGRISQVYIHPSRVKVSEKNIELSEDELKMLVCMQYTSAYRKDYAKRLKVGAPDLTNSLVQSLVTKGLLKKAGAGVSMTPEGKNHLKANQEQARKIEYSI